MSKKKRDASATPVAVPTSPAATTAPATTASAAPADPRRGPMANLVLIGFSLYVALIWLLALDQQFHWGIFKP